MKGLPATAFGLAILGGAALFLSSPVDLRPQVPQQIKVLFEARQDGDQSNLVVQGSGSVIVRRDSVQPSGRLSAGQSHTQVQRSTGIFTLVRDGGESILTVATKIPYDQIFFYHNYAAGAGYIARGVAFHEVGTSLRVSATILPHNQVQVRLTPRVSYFSPDRSGAIDFTEAATEVIVPNGQPVSLGGSTTKMHEVTRRVLGFARHSGDSETSLTLTTTIQ